MPSCSVKWCGKSSANSSYAKDGITFHRFPREASMKEVWINATRRDFFPTKCSVICSRHFTPDCFENIKNNRRRLYISSVPTLYLPILVPLEDSKNTQGELSSSQENKNESSNRTNSEGQNDKNINEHSKDLTPRERQMKRRIVHLIYSLNKTKKFVKRLQSQTYILRKKVSSLQETIDTLTKKT